MKVLSKKKVRFGLLVEKLGTPKSVVLWTKPQEDADFMRAVKQHRVVTILGSNVGTKKDVGIPGFVGRPGATYLVFPKPLPYSEETQIIGINYDLIASSPAKGPLWKPSPKPKIKKTTAPTKLEPLARDSPKVKAESRKPPAPKLKVPKKIAPPPLREFRATAELTARQTFDLKVLASTKSEAKKLLEKELAGLSLNASIRQRKLGRIVVNG